MELSVNTMRLVKLVIMGIIGVMLRYRFEVTLELSHLGIMIVLTPLFLYMTYVVVQLATDLLPNEHR